MYYKQHLAIIKYSVFLFFFFVCSWWHFKFVCRVYLFNFLSYFACFAFPLGCLEIWKTKRMSFKTASVQTQGYFKLQTQYINVWNNRDKLSSLVIMMSTVMNYGASYFQATQNHIYSTERTLLKRMSVDNCPIKLTLCII